MRAVVAVLVLVMVAASPATAQTACRQALALGLDVSGSVDTREYRLQLDGLAAALADPDVRAAILAMPSAPVRIAVYEWSSPADQRLIVPWTALTSEDVINGAIALLRGWSRTDGDPSTAIGAALLNGAALLDQQRSCWKRTLDISGDGKSNTGPHPRDISTSARMAPYTVNALVIGADAPRNGDRREMQVGELAAYFRFFVISGPDAFVETALGFQDYQAAMTRKLLRELEGLALSSADRPALSRLP